MIKKIFIIHSFRQHALQDIEVKYSCDTIIKNLIAEGIPAEKVYGIYKLLIFAK